MVVAHGETAVANQARHLCSGREERASEQETLLETNKEDGGGEQTKRHISRARVRMVWNGQWLGGIWVRESQTDRRNGVVAGSSEKEGDEPDGGKWAPMGGSVWGWRGRQIDGRWGGGREGGGSGHRKISDKNL